MGPEFDKDLATERADNFASGFLDVGAAAVFALGWTQKLNLPAALARHRQDHGRDLHDQAAATARTTTTASWAGTTTTASSTRTRAPASTWTPTSVTVTCAPSPATWSMTAGRVARRGARRPTTRRPRCAGQGHRHHRRRRDRRRRRAAHVQPQRGRRRRPDGHRPHAVGAGLRRHRGAQRRPTRWSRSLTRFGEMGDGQSYWDGRNDAGGVVDGRALPGPPDAARPGRQRGRGRIRGRARCSPACVASRPRSTPSTSRTATTLADVGRRSARTCGATPWSRGRIRRNGNRRPHAVRRGRAVAAGDLTWRWDGTDDSGATVPDGTVHAFIAATTDDGHPALQRPDRVSATGASGSATARPSAATTCASWPSARSPSRRVPTLEIDQPGLGPARGADEAASTGTRRR